jgi:phospholipase/carboxylesterase
MMRKTPQPPEFKNRSERVKTEISTFQIDQWLIRYRSPDGDGPHPVIWLLHGWTGDENSMWVFASRLPERYLLLAPRGLYSTPMGGYGWHSMTGEKVWPWVDDFRPAIDQLNVLMDHWPAAAPPADFSRFRIAGFSQGGALAYSYALLHPRRVLALAGLASFLPDGAAIYLQDRRLQGIPVYISHGIKDQLVPVARARQAVQLLDQAGALVSYCESEVGHKLSADCFKGMEIFFEE